MDRERSSRFEAARSLAALISKDYSYDLLRLLVMYKDISASEAAARLRLHIKTAQDFLEALAEAGIVEKREAEEKKRPYFRFSLLEDEILIRIDLASLYDREAASARRNRRVRERKNSGVLFKEGKGERISAIHVFEGEGRSRSETRLNLTECQGRFLFHLPFPTEDPLGVFEICRKAGLDEDCLPEVLDLVDFLERKRILDLDREALT